MKGSITSLRRMQGGWGMGPLSTSNIDPRMSSRLRSGKYPASATNELRMIQTYMRVNDERVRWNAVNMSRSSTIVGSMSMQQTVRVRSW